MGTLIGGFQPHYKTEAKRNAFHGKISFVRFAHERKLIFL